MMFQFYIEEGDPPEVVQAEATQQVALQLERIADALEEEEDEWGSLP